MNRSRVVSALSALTLAASAGLLLAGPLTPPAGPIASTGKTTQEIYDKAVAAEPRIAINATNTPGDNDSTPSLFKITQPGSYYLTGNITGVAGKHGIEITASGVTLDLNGFDLVGVTGMGNFDGVTATAPGLTSIEVRNGSIRNWGNKGINFSTTGPRGGAVGNVRVSGNAGSGIAVGNGTTVSACSAYNNGAIGISAGSGSTLTGCSAYNNVGDGIWTSTSCVVSGCAAFNNTGAGVYALDGCAVTECAAYSNSGRGVSASRGSTVSACTASSNSGDGISADDGSTVSACTSRGNTASGILVSSGCLVTVNSCTSNGVAPGDGAGIHATGTRNRLEGNTCTSGGRGIDVDAAGNIIIKNTCSGNTTNWDIATGNAVASIVNAVTNSGPIVGNIYIGNVGSTDPNANFTY